MQKFTVLSSIINPFSGFFYQQNVGIFQSKVVFCGGSSEHSKVSLYSNCRIGLLMYILILCKKDDEKGGKDFSKDIMFHNINACISELSGLLVCYIFELTLFL